jgi:hypothetical protein
MSLQTHIAGRRAGLFIGLLLKSSLALTQWDVSMFMQPFPSPYLSDWEHNPTIGSLTITNNTSSPTDVLIYLTLIRNSSGVIATGNSNPISTSPGVPTQVNSDRFIDWGTVTYNTSTRDQAIQTGRLPEGEYNACVTVKDPSGAILASNVCAPFTIVYPSPPSLFLPVDGDSLTSSCPLFTWTPVQVPPAYQLHYVLKIVEILSGQIPHQALLVNVVQYEDNNLLTTNIQYPMSALLLEPGKSYAWQVQAVDQNGFPPSGNEGRSEIWTFAMKDQLGQPPSGPQGAFRGRIVFYDPATETPPPLFAGMDTVSFESFSARVEGSIPSGLLIPVPCPRDSGAAPTATPAPIELPSLRGSRKDSGSTKSWALYARLPGDKFNSFLTARGVPTWNHPQAEGGVDFLATVVWKGGLPQITFAIKPRMNLLSLFGLSTQFAAFIINPLGDFVIDSNDLPEDFRDFYGSNKVEVWGPGIIDALTGAGFKNLGLNFHAVVDLGNSSAVQAIANWANVDRLHVTFRGFVGLGVGRENTFIGSNFGATGAAKTQDKWFLRATVPARIPEFLQPIVKSRRLSFEIGRTDSVFINGIKNYAKYMGLKVKKFGQTVLRSDSSAKALTGNQMNELTEEYVHSTRNYRVVVTDMVTMTDTVKDLVGGTRFLDTGDSLVFFASYMCQVSGVTKSLFSGSPSFSLTYGSNISINIFDLLHLHRPFLTFRVPLTATLNPFNTRDLSISLGGSFGITVGEWNEFEDFGMIVLKVDKVDDVWSPGSYPRRQRQGEPLQPNSSGVYPPPLPQKPLKSYMAGKDKPAANVKVVAPKRKWRFQVSALISQGQTMAGGLKLGAHLAKKIIDNH